MPKIAKELKTNFEIEARKGTKFNVGGITGLKCDYRHAHPYYYLQWTKNGKTKTYPLRVKTLKDAKSKARQIRELIDKGIDPEERDKQREAEQEEIRRKEREESEKKLNTLKSVSVKYFEYGLKLGYWNGKDKGRNKINRFNNSRVMKELGNLPITEITPQIAFEHFKNYWIEIPGQADKTHTTLNQIFNFAVAHKLTTSNPVDKKGAFGVLIAALTKARTPKQNEPAPSYEQVNELIKECIPYKSISKKAFIFQVLTATRGEATITLEWDDVNLENKEAIIKPENDKGSKEFRDINRPRNIYLSEQVILLLKSIPRISKYVFPSREGGGFKHIGEGAINAFLNGIHEKRKLKDGIGWVDPNNLDKETGLPRKIVPHGTARSTFKTWSVETGQNERAAELCLFHLPKDLYKGAYNRATLVKQRRKLMQDWADYCLQGIDLKELFG